jgi:hypothetical protein
MNGASAPLEQAPAFVANAHDALRTVEFIHNYEPPADLRARGAFTTTSVMDRTISTSAAAQAVPLLATITDQQTVSGGTVEFTVLQSNGTLVGVAASGPVTNGIGTADYVIPAATPAGSYIILAAYSGATGFAASRGTGTLTISATPVDPCTAVILPTTAIAPAEGGTASVVVTIAPGCAWTAVPSDSWIVPAVTSGTGTATIEYETSRNTSGAARVGSLTIAGQILEITQPPMVALRSDFNGDGSPDLIFQHADGRVVVWFMDGITQIGSATLASPTDPNWRVAGVADFNTDGAADLLWQHRTTGALSIWLMKGTTMQSAVAVPEQPSDPLWKVVGLDDVNHDGYTDLIWQHQTTRMVLLWLMNGYVRQSATTIVATVGEGWRIAAVAHVDGDEHVDLVWQNTTTGAISLWTLVAGVVKDGRAFDAPIVTDPSWKLVSAADLNGDGNVDLVWQHVDGRVVVWYMNGATFESSAQIAPAGDDPAWRLVVVR